MFCTSSSDLWSVACRNLSRKYYAKPELQLALSTSHAKFELQLAIT